MSSKCHAVTNWDVLRWFALLSPLIGVFVLYH